MPKDISTRKQYDSKSRTLHVWPSSLQIWVGEPREKNDKTADLDEIFGRKKDEDNDDK